MKNTLLGIAALIALILGLLFASVMLPRPMSEAEAQRLGFYRFEAPRAITAFAMTDHEGHSVGLPDLSGQWSLLFFGFTTCPHICPTTLKTLADAVAGLDEPPRVVMVSVDPERDTPERLGQYMPAFHPSFRGFTGSFDETVKLAGQLNIAFGKVPGNKPGDYMVDHSTSLVLVNPEGQYAGFIKAPHNAQNIRRVLRAL